MTPRGRIIALDCLHASHLGGGVVSCAAGLFGGRPSVGVYERCGERAAGRLVTIDTRPVQRVADDFDPAVERAAARQGGCCGAGSVVV